MKTAGIDSCKAGWLLVSFDSKEGGEYRILRQNEELRGIFDEFDRIFIDIPIGLSDEEYSRNCDERLRQKLGEEYRELVVIPPIRPALDAPTFVEANTRTYELTGRSFSLPAWSIITKIRFVDGCLRTSPELQERVLESHPEFLFMNLNGGGMIYQGRNTKKGVKHRLDLVREQESGALGMFRNIKETFRRNEVSEEVIADAIVLAHAARVSARKGVKTIPGSPEADSQGLPMAIHFV